MDTRTSKVARDKRKQVRQKSKSVVAMAPLVPTKGIKRGQFVPGGGSNENIIANQDSSTNVFSTPDGKNLEEVLTKQLKNSDVTILGRIVLPKREAEAKLPPLTDKEGKDIMLMDVYSGVSWTLRYKYWSNNRSRMYVLENAGEFVNHYGLQMGDFITIYVDEEKNLYVWARKKIIVEAPVSLDTHDTDNYNNMHQFANEDVEIFPKELNQEKEVEDANKLLTSFNGGGSSSCRAELRMSMAENDVEVLNITAKGAPSQEIVEATPIAPTTPHNGRNMLISDEDVYEGLDNIFEIENNFHSFDYLKDFRM
ncbi:unnamed protein product [Sphenostylis stenocarpa]|uniref:TF-B3 domain-containing protein n=1 Tax=Sphenostylis stenocarpa TaxID=92480 RepID=A0AA86S7U0_9FABA|nr:unnamed protein product [Sphenostylis stenocarpa]